MNKQYRLKKFKKILHGCMSIIIPKETEVFYRGAHSWRVPCEGGDITFAIHPNEQDEWIEEIVIKEIIQVAIGRLSDASKDYHPTFGYLITATHEIPESKFIEVKKAITDVLNDRPTLLKEKDVTCPPMAYSINGVRYTRSDILNHDREK